MEELLVYIQSRVTFVNIIEVAIIAFFIYEVLMWIRGTQAEQVAKGIFVLLILAPLSSWLGFTTLSYLLNNLFTWAFIIFVVVFQPELRSALEQIGNRGFFDRFTKTKEKVKIEKDIREITEAVEHLSGSRIGALIVCEMNTGLNDIVGTGIVLNSDISTELLENIFTPNRPLHDGAVIIDLKNGKIRAAGCLLPLTDNRKLDSELGTRHRAGIGISEKSDALTIIVSEETGIISYTERGGITRMLTSEDLEILLQDRFTKNEDDEEDDKKGSIFGRKHDESKEKA
ncbi:MULTISPECIES: diadenylate cyclase CdaA [Eubacterium]|uniref:Diadenylate cyclase n=1 Tax=Eubacterium barkeri TaxID=1528 RepID=A0A1H3FCN7_EUBBA|nr:diadenylate cyclase CdaA [Eubacterium barkeri]SDX88843.1 diadenylate cyclase [Eubacterium barkeri]